jgi:hypothetical protein
VRNLLKKLQASIRKILQGDCRLPNRRARLGLEVLERRDVLAAPTDIVSVSFGGTLYEFGLSGNMVVRSADNGNTWKAVTGTNTNATQLLADNGGLYMLGGNNGPAMQNVWQYSGSGTNWAQITGPYMNASDLTVCNGGLFMLGTNGPANETVYQWTGTGSKWTAITGSNTNATDLTDWNGYLVMLGGNGGIIQSVWEYSGAGTNWNTITGPNMNVTAIAKEAGNLFMVGSNGPAYQTVCEYTGTGSKWTAVTDSSTNANALARANGNLYMLATSQGSTYDQVYVYYNSGTSWALASATDPAASALTSLDGNLYMLGSNGAGGQSVFEYNDSSFTWTDVSSGYLSATALVRSNGFLFALGSAGTTYQSVWQYSPGSNSWTAITSNGTYAASLAAAQGGLFMLGTNGPGYNTVWEYSGSGQSWNAVTDTNKEAYQLIVADNSLYMMASNNGGTAYVWQYSNSGTSWTVLLGSSLSTALTTWSLYTSEPVAGDSYSPASGSLFASGGPAYTDVQQGDLGDCWLLASFAEAAARAPGDINSMFLYDGSTTEGGSTVGVYSVRFCTALGTAEYVTVDTELPGGGTEYDLPNGDFWVALAEKAYAEANGLGYVTTNNPIQGGYAALNQGWPSWALSAITGVPATDFTTINPTAIANAWNAGELIVLGSDTTAQNANIVGDHAYALVGYSSLSSTPFQIYNPWGTNANGLAPGGVWGLQWIDTPTLTSNFDVQSMGAGSAATGGWQRWANDLTTESLPDWHAQGGAPSAVSGVDSDAEQAVPLGVGSDDVGVWVNGGQAHDGKGGRQAGPEQDLVEARVKKGWNEVRAKVGNHLGIWELDLEFRTDAGEPLEVSSANSLPTTTAR